VSFISSYTLHSSTNWY